MRFLGRSWWKKVLEPKWVAAAAIVLITAAAYWPVLKAGFIWDDDDHLTRNPCIIGPLGFKEIWTSIRAFYYPLVLTTFWLLHKLVALNPLPYHALNVLIHAGSALLLWRVLQLLDVRGAWLGAALWAVHPVMVQSVAWITELKNTQSCFFYLMSILFFLKADGNETSRQRWKWCFGLSLLSFVMAITSKPSTAMLPVVLALCLWWRRRQFRWRDLAGLVPFLLISAAASAWTIWEQKFHSGALGTTWAQTWPQRLAIAGYDVWFYLAKLLWPHPLIFIYPRWKIDTRNLAVFLPLLAVVTGMLLLWWKRNGPLRSVFFGASYFLVSLFPLLGFFNVYFFSYSYVSDHFQYLASMGLAALAGAALSRSPQIICLALLGIFGLLTWHQTQIYRDPEALWYDTIAKNPRCGMAHNNLGVVLKDRGHVSEAMLEYREAIKIDPDNAGAHNNLGNALVKIGQVEEAIAEYQTGLRIEPAFAEGYDNLGNAFLQKGQLNEAIACFQKTCELKPNYAEARNDLGNALLIKGEVDQAIVHYQQALEIKPDYAEVEYNLGVALRQRGEIEQAVAHFEKALRLKPNFEEAKKQLRELGVSAPN